MLEKFEWPLSLHRLNQKVEHRGNNKFYGYMIYFKYVIIIWSRIIDDLKTYQSLSNSTYNVIFPRGRTGKHILTAHEKDLMSKTDTAKAVLEVDYESFLIFVSILLDKIAQLVASILSENKKNLIPTRSFHDHKKYFLNPSEEFLRVGNIPRSIKQKYAKLVRERTEWYDMSLKLARDKLVAHGDKYTIGISTNTKGGIRINKENIFADFSNEGKQLIEIKKKYVAKYSELKSVEDNLWEIMDFFMNYNIELEKQDKQSFINIVYKTGGPLPTLYFVAKNTGNFIEEVARTFGISYITTNHGELS